MHRKKQDGKNPPCFFNYALCIVHCSATAAAVVVTATAIVATAAAVVAATATAAAKDYNKEDYPAAAAVSAKKSVITHD